MIENIRVLSLASRACGCHPQRISGDAGKSSRISRAYCFLVGFLYCLPAACYFSQMACGSAGGSSVASCMLFHIRKFLTVVAAVAGNAVAATRYAGFERAVRTAKEFDELANYAEKSFRPGLQLAAVALCHGWYIAAYVSTAEALPKVHIIVIVALLLMRVGINAEILKFCALLSGLERRFRYLNERCSGTGETSPASLRKRGARLTPLNVYELHKRLMQSATSLNGYYNLQLLCWMIVLLLELIAFVLLSAESTSARNRVAVPSIAAIVGHAFLQISILAYFSHGASKQANMLGDILFAFGSPLISRSASYMEFIELGFYIRRKRFHVVAGNLFYIDMSIIIAVIGYVRTYVSLFKS